MNEIDEIQAYAAAAANHRKHAARRKEPDRLCAEQPARLIFGHQFDQAFGIPRCQRSRDMMERHGLAGAVRISFTLCVKLTDQDGHVAARQCPVTPPFASPASGKPCLGHECPTSLLTGAGERGTETPPEGLPERARAADPESKV